MDLLRRIFPGLFRGVRRPPARPQRAKARKKVWRLGGVTLAAHTKGEARSLFKRKLGVARKGRLPVGVQVEQLEY